MRTRRASRSSAACRWALAGHFIDVHFIDSDGPWSGLLPYEELPQTSSFVLAFRALPLVLVVSALSASCGLTWPR